jgi:GNAT superfamily N-acetyltransferase
VTAAPVPLLAVHDTLAFDCGVDTLNDWLKRRALANQNTGASKTFVVAENGIVSGYYALANGAASLGSVPGRVRRNMPEPAPVMVLGRLAVDKRWQGTGLGRGLLKDAVLRTRRATEIAGIRALMVHAIDDKAAAFYVRWGFLPSPIEPRTLFLPLY